MLDGEGAVSEPGIARVFSKIDGDLFLGNSMPVRDYDSCGFGGGRVFGNRGASGIDGNIATIAGVAMAGGRGLTAVLGDLAALHDLNSLPLLRGLPVALVVVNNDGGGIFRFLPLNVGAEERERLWETPHGFDFRQAAGQFGIRYAAVGTRAELEAELRGGKLPVLIECRTERGVNHDLHRRIAEEVRRLGIRWS
jgi:2-succinyl-5-enolpyruvyl-6-hydroxy-3-cyclohexene-1-carboxylate synthase